MAIFYFFKFTIMLNIHHLEAKLLSRKMYEAGSSVTFQGSIARYQIGSNGLRIWLNVSERVTQTRGRHCLES